MNKPVKNLHGISRTVSDTKPSDKKAFSVVEASAPEPASLISSAPRKRYPYANTKERYRNPALLKACQVRNLHLADEHAAKIGLPLNTFVTISWLLTAHPDIDAGAFTKSINPIRAWLARHGVTLTYAYVHENPASKAGDSIPNTHLLVHVPKPLIAAFKAKAPEWFDATMDGAVKVDPRRKPGYSGPDRRVQYMCKGSDFFTCKRYGGGRQHDGQGVVQCKRSGCSQNIGWKARGAFQEKSAHKRKAGAS